MSLPYGVFTRADDFAWWCEQNLVQSVDRFAGLPLLLEPWQLTFLEEALALDGERLPYWQLVVLVVARKNGKTALLAAYSLYHLLEDEGSPEILLAASSDKQAGRLFDAAVAFVRRNPVLGERLHVREYVGEIARSDGRGKLLRMASDPNRAHGYSPSLVVCDELHAWTTPSLRKAWGAFTTGGGARRNTQVFAITTAGEAHERETGVLGRLIDGNQKHGQPESRPGLTVSRNHDSRVLVYNHSAPTSDRHDIAALKLANPASWISEDYLRQQAQSDALSDAEVLQLHGCVWAAGADAWITADAWARCHQEGVLIPDGSQVCVGVDVALVHDTTAVAVAWQRDDGRIVVEATVFAADRNAVADHYQQGPSLDLEQIEQHIRSLGNRFQIMEIAYDPRFFERSAQLLADHYLVFPLHQSSAPMADAYQAFYASVMEGRLCHAGGRTLTAHVMATAAEKTDRGWKIRKMRQSQRIDATVATVIASWRAEQQATGYLMVLD